ncbi:MAG: hypothetical protein J6T74_05825 [Clostridia bacterium]|nr:hypothetical protein [Clostridia bacterium]
MDYYNQKVYCKIFKSRIKTQQQTECNKYWTEWKSFVFHGIIPATLTKIKKVLTIIPSSNVANGNSLIMLEILIL